LPVEGGERRAFGEDDLQTGAQDAALHVRRLGVNGDPVHWSFGGIFGLILAAGGQEKSQAKGACAPKTTTHKNLAKNTLSQVLEAPPLYWVEFLPS
jgi:hypothetical protein